MVSFADFIVHRLDELLQPFNFKANCFNLTSLCLRLDIVDFPTSYSVDTNVTVAPQANHLQISSFFIGVSTVHFLLAVAILILCNNKNVRITDGLVNRRS